MSKQTKRVSIPPAVLQNLQGNEEDALAYFLQLAFGATLEEIFNALNYMIAVKNTRGLQMCATSGVQIRGNVVLVGADPTFRVPELKVFLIEGQRDIQDAYNFSALHIAGHMLAIITTHAWGKKINSKAGNCVNGDTFPDSDAGKINKEIRNSWTQESVSQLNDLVVKMDAGNKTFVDEFFAGVSARATRFSNLITPNAVAAAQPRSKAPAPKVTATVTGQQPSGMS